MKTLSGPALLAEIEKVIGKSQGKDHMWTGIDIDKIDELIEMDLLCTPVVYQGRLTEALIIDLMRRHPELKATGEFSDQGVLLNGLRGEKLRGWNRPTLKDLLEFTGRYGYDFRLSSSSAEFWFHETVV